MFVKSLASTKVGFSESPPLHLGESAVERTIITVAATTAIAARLMMQLYEVDKWCIPKNCLLYTEACLNWICFVHSFKKIMILILWFYDILTLFVLFHNNTITFFIVHCQGTTIFLYALYIHGYTFFALVLNISTIEKFRRQLMCALNPAIVFFLFHL